MKNISIAQIPLGTSHHVSTRLDTFDVSSPCILAVSSLSNSTAPLVRHDELDWIDTSNVSCRVETWRDEPSEIWAYDCSCELDFCEILNRKFAIYTQCSESVTTGTIDFFSIKSITLCISEIWMRHSKCLQTTLVFRYGERFFAEFSRYTYTLPVSVVWHF